MSFIQGPNRVNVGPLNILSHRNHEYTGVFNKMSMVVLGFIIFSVIWYVYLFNYIDDNNNDNLPFYKDKIYALFLFIFSIIIYGILSKFN
tara:strand:- start:1427 stop:1696 length:270 start_codon:yes stop_codon:yes gene_type:complete